MRTAQGGDDAVHERGGIGIEISHRGRGGIEGMGHGETEAGDVGRGGAQRLAGKVVAACGGGSNDEYRVRLALRDVGVALLHQVDDDRAENHHEHPALLAHLLDGGVHGADHGRPSPKPR